MDEAGLAPGDVVDGRYVVESELGRGGYGTVWRVRHQRLDAARALKVLHQAGPELAARLRAEGQVLARLEHPNIVRVHDLVELGDQLALVMELVEGPSLAEFLREGPPDLETVAHVGRGILQGLAEAHRRGVLHRDLKPGNILLATGDGPPTPKLVDFGLAVESGDGRLEAAGTPAYMAPEQLEGRCDERSDLFSAATVLYELATGHRTFDTGGLAQLMMAKAQGRFDPPRSLRPELPAGMARVLREGLSPDPGARPASADHMVASWKLPADARSLVPAAPEALPGDLASLGDSRATDRALVRRLPTPVSAAWQRVVRAATEEARREAVEIAVHATLRFVLALLLADYLAGPDDPSVEGWLAECGTYDADRWLVGVGHTATALAARSDRFVTDAPLLVPGQPLQMAFADVLAVIEGPVEQRVGEVRGLLVALLFLDRTRLFRPLVSRGGGTGKVQFLVGADGVGEPASSAWTAELVDRSVYALSPAGGEVLDLSPLVRLDHDQGDVAVFAGVRRGEVGLADLSGVVRWARPVGRAGVPVPLEQVLAERGEARRRQSNRDELGALAAPGTSSVSGVVVGGRFELHDVLGVGGMSTVHRAWDRLADEEVALKLLAVDFASDPEFRERFKREAQRMRQLDHPHVLSAVELGSLDSGQLWLRMPVLDGGTLRERIAAGDIDEAQADRWTRELLSALVALEEAGVVHRDIKPSNLLLDRDGHLVLVDFGVALSEDDARLTRTLQQLGSLAYLAPECRGAGQATHVSDVYSAALVIHELATGRTAGALPGKGVDGVLGHWLRRMGRVDPDDRPRAIEVLAALEGPETGSLPLTEHDVPHTEPLTEPGADDRRVLALGVPLGALAGIALGLPGWTVLPLEVAPAFEPRGLLAGVMGTGPLVWPAAAAGVAMLGLPGLGFGHAKRHGAMAGAIAGSVAFAVGGVQVALMLGSRPVFTALTEGDLDTARVIGDAMVRLSWFLLGGGLLAPLVGAASAFALAQLRPADRPTSRPDLPLRMLAGAALLVLGSVGEMTRPGVNAVMDSVRHTASASVGLEVTLGGVRLMAAVPSVLAQIVGLTLCASPRAPALEGETVIRVLLLGAVVALQSLIQGPTGMFPAVVSGVVLASVLAWRRPWTLPPSEPPRRDLMGLAAAPLAAIAVGSMALPLVQLGLAALSSLVWNLPALQGDSDPLAAHVLAEAQLQHHFATTRLVLAASALLTLATWTVVGVITGALDWLRTRRFPHRDELVALAVGHVVVFMMVFGTGHDLFEATRADPRPDLPSTAPHELSDTVWRSWVRGDALHTPLHAEADAPEAERWVAAAAAHLQGRARPDMGELSEGGRAFVAHLDGDPEPLHTYLANHDDPVLSSLHHAAGAVPWGHDPHEAMETPLPGEQLLWMRRMVLAGEADGAEAIRVQWDERHGGGGLLELERAWAAQWTGTSASAALAAARQRAPGRIDARVASLVNAITTDDRALEQSLRDELLPLTSASAFRLPTAHIADVAFAYAAAGRAQTAVDLLRVELGRARTDAAAPDASPRRDTVRSERLRRMAGIAQALRPHLGDAGRPLDDELALLGTDAVPYRHGPCAADLATDPDAAVDRSRCPRTPQLELLSSQAPRPPVTP